MSKTCTSVVSLWLGWSGPTSRSKSASYAGGALPYLPFGLSTHHPHRKRLRECDLNLRHSCQMLGMRGRRRTCALSCPGKCAVRSVVVVAVIVASLPLLSLRLPSYLHDQRDCWTLLPLNRTGIVSWKSVSEVRSYEKTFFGDGDRTSEVILAGIATTRSMVR